MPKTIMITGASSGIGAAAAEYLGRDNNKILIHYNTSLEAAEKVAQLVRDNGGRAHLLQADVSSNEGCVSLYNQVIKITDRLDVLINNAGGLIRHSVTEITWDIIEKMFSLNVFSAMKITGLMVPLLQKGTLPCIINITSIGARSGSSSAPAYGAAKGALDSFTRGAAMALAPKIRVNSIAPGYTDTPFQERNSTPEAAIKRAEKLPLKRIGDVMSIAQAIGFLIECEFITGESLDINGGEYMR